MTIGQIRERVRSYIFEVQHETFFKHVNWALLAAVLVVCGLLTDYIKTWSFFDAFSFAISRRVLENADLRGEPKSVVTALVTTQDLKDQWDRRRPLPPEHIAILVARLLAAGASTVGVDFDTSHEEYKRISPLLVQLAGRDALLRVVWAIQEERPACRGEIDPDCQVREKGDRRPTPFVLGAPVTDGEIQVGSVDIPMRFGLVTEVPFEHRGARSFSGKAVTMFLKMQTQPSLRINELPSSFPLDRLYRTKQLVASNFFDSKGWAVVKRPASKETIADQALRDVLQQPASVDLAQVKDRIVFLGPTYDRGDVFSTPWGKIPGVALHASAAAYCLDFHDGKANVETGGVLAWVRKWLIKACLACIVAFCFYRFRPLFATLAVFGIGYLFVMLSVFLAEEWGLFHLNAGPFLIGLWLEQVVESSLHHKGE